MPASRRRVLHPASPPSAPSAADRLGSGIVKPSRRPGTIISSRKLGVHLLGHCQSRGTGVCQESWFFLLTCQDRPVKSENRSSRHGGVMTSELPHRIASDLSSRRLYETDKVAPWRDRRPADGPRGSG